MTRCGKRRCSSIGSPAISGPTAGSRSRALYVIFFLPGFALSSWVTRTPTIRDSLHATTSQMGLLLLGLSVGSMLGVLLAGKFVAAFGTRYVAVFGTIIMAMGCLLVGFTALFKSPSIFLSGLFLFGLGMATTEIALNIDGADLERRTGRSVLTIMHGCFSLGTLMGGAIGYFANLISIPIPWQLGATAVSSFFLTLCLASYLPLHMGKRPSTSEPNGIRGASLSLVWVDSTLILIAICVLSITLAEGAAHDWLTLLMVDDRGFDPARAALIYTGFTMAMTVGRFGGSWLIQRTGKIGALQITVTIGAIGIAAIIFSPVAWLAGSAAIFWGIGVSLGVPIALSLAGEGRYADTRVSAVAAGGYGAFLVGPPILGFLGGAIGLRMALLVLLAGMAVSLCLTAKLSRR